MSVVSKGTIRHGRLAEALLCLALSLGGSVPARAEEPLAQEESAMAPETHTDAVVDDAMSVAEVPADSEEGDTTLFDLYLGDALRGLTLATFTDEWLEVKDVEGVVEQLGPLNKTTSLKELFSGRIEKTRVIDGVGSVSYDLNTFRVLVALDPSYLPGKEVGLSSRLPNPKNEFALQQSFGIAGSGEFGADASSAFNHRTFSSIGKYYLRYDGTALANNNQSAQREILPEVPGALPPEDLPAQDNYELDVAAVGGILGDYRLDTGALRSDGREFVGSVDFLGAAFGTAEDIFVSQEALRGSRFQIFVPSRSRVEFYRSDRLLAVQMLDFGLQDIDTSAFPQGSYEVDIVMHQDNGSITRDRRFPNPLLAALLSARPRRDF